MQRYFETIDALNEVGAVLEFAREICADLGAKRMSYHVTPLFDEPTSMSTCVFAAGFSDEWLDLYDREECRRDDPIPGRVMDHGGLMTWRDAMHAGTNTSGNEAYFARMREHGLIHGFGIPLFGPRGRDAYASFDFDRPMDEVDTAAIGTVRSVAQAAHQRISALLDERAQRVTLSEREEQVLIWTARGKSASSIAAILDLSPDTVKTYLKRIYAKLEVSDRVGAVVKALRLGIVKV